MTDLEMMARYRDLRDVTQAMLAAAEARDYDLFELREADQATMVNGLRLEDTEQPISLDAVSLKKEIIEEILVLQGIITDLIVPWRATVASLANATGAAKRVYEAYGDTPGTG